MGFHKWVPKNDSSIIFGYMGGLWTSSCKWCRHIPHVWPFFEAGKWWWTTKLEVPYSEINPIYRWKMVWWLLESKLHDFCQCLIYFLFCEFPSDVWWPEDKLWGIRFAGYPYPYIPWVVPSRLQISHISRGAMSFPRWQLSQWRHEESVNFRCATTAELDLSLEKPGVFLNRCHDFLGVWYA